MKDIWYKKDFEISVAEMRKIMKGFIGDMEKGLSGRKSSLKMLPAYTGTANGCESGRLIALDLGGTNFRVLELDLKGKRKMGSPRVKKFTIDKKHMTGRGEDLFDFIAKCIRTFISEKGLEDELDLNLGFTFSFPIDQKAIARGLLIRWTKGFSASGVKGKDVVKLLKDALKREDLSSMKVSALANDTVGTLVARSYQDPGCDVGVIIGTGTNACYLERVRNIKKLKDADKDGYMIVNTEWGNFNKLRLTEYDMELDRISENRKEQILEKMVSGMYLGEVARLVIKDAAGRGYLSGHIGTSFGKKYSFKTEYMSGIEGDSSKELTAVKRILKKKFRCNLSLEERRLLKDICAAVSRRAARISAASLAAVVSKMDKVLSHRHTIAIDGSVYEKHPTFARNMKSALKDIFGSRASRINIALTKDGSGTGAAIMAAIAG